MVPGEGALFIINDRKVIINEYNNYEPAKRSSSKAWLLGFCFLLLSFPVEGYLCTWIHLMLQIVNISTT